MQPRPYDIRERSYVFTREVIVLCRKAAADRDFVMRRLISQLVDSAGSVGANLEEADDGQTKPDFISKTSIALKEVREARFWLRQLKDIEPRLAQAAKPLIDEAEQLKKILRTIVIRAKKKRDRGRNVV